MTEYNCETEGHIWRFYDSHTPVDKNGKDLGYRYAVGGKAEKMRLCPVCKKKQRLPSTDWEDVT